MCQINVVCLFIGILVNLVCIKAYTYKKAFIIIKKVIEKIKTRIAEVTEK